MEITIKPITKWSRVLNSARFTLHKEELDKEPSESFKRRILLSEHSPIRLLEYDITIRGAKRWVVDHLVRHHIGVTPFVATQRTDRYEEVKTMNRDNMSQGMPTDVMFSVNAQALINISRKRLCGKASKETRELWRDIIRELAKIDPIMAEKCAPECVYRGFCAESECCGLWKSSIYSVMRNEYLLI